MSADLDPRIGVLNSGQYYAFPNGYDQPEVRGTREQVEAALGLAIADYASAVRGDRYTVTIRFQHPAWDERDGIVYEDILARSKSEAIRIVRTKAYGNGHTGTGKGRTTFTARLEA